MAYVTLEELETHLGIGRKRDWYLQKIREGHIPFLRLGNKTMRFDVDDVRAALKSHFGEQADGQPKIIRQRRPEQPQPKAKKKKTAK